MLKCQGTFHKGQKEKDPEFLHPARRYFSAEGCKLRVGTYTASNVMCIYLESDAPAGGAPPAAGGTAGGAGGAQGAGAEKNFWVKSRVAVVNARFPERTTWKESAICTKTWNNSVLQLAQVRRPALAWIGTEH